MTGQAGRTTTRPRRVIHGDVSQIAGRPKVNSVLWLVVLAALAVDIITFYQVLVLVLDVYEWMVWVSVGGFAVVALALAHHTGVQFRQATNPRNLAGSVTTAWITCGLWLALGVVAFVARLFISLPSTAGMSTFDVDGTASATLAESADATSQRLSALLFLVLYLSTGAIAGVHGYFRPEPAIKQYGRALERRSEMARRQASSGSLLAFANHTLASINDARDRRIQALQQAQEQGRVIAERLQQEAVAHLTSIRRRGATRRFPGYAPPSPTIGRADAPIVPDIPPFAADATQELRAADFGGHPAFGGDPTQEPPPATEGTPQ